MFESCRAHGNPERLPRRRGELGQSRTSPLTDAGVDEEVDVPETERLHACRVRVEASAGRRFDHIEPGRECDPVRAVAPRHRVSDEASAARAELQRCAGNRLRARLLGHTDWRDRPARNRSVKAAPSRLRLRGPRGENPGTDESQEVSHLERVDAREGRPCGRPSSRVRTASSAYGVSLLILVDQFASAVREPGPCDAPPHVPSRLSPEPPTKNGPPQSV
jgi:hypothetical protein